MDSRTSRTRLGIGLLAVAGAALFPVLTGSEYLLRMGTLIVFWIGVAGCWNISSGYTGYIDFGPVAYWGIGSYTTALFMARLDCSFGLSLFLAGSAALGIALGVGVATLRLKGAYFAIATFAFAETLKQVVMEFDRTFGVSLFQGSHGITLPIAPHGNEFFYYCSLAATFLVLAAHHWIENSKIGYGLKAVRGSEATAEMAGVNTLGIKLTAYAFSAFFLGIFGGIHAYWITYITPQDAFNIHKTVQMVIMNLLGGMGTFLGPIVGASFLTTVSEVLGIAFVEYYLIIVGAIIVGVILLMPKGIIGSLKERRGFRSI